jgi:hypothetical protein
MQRQHVSSSNVHSIGYDKDTQILEVEYNNGGIYEYSDVPASEYEALMLASSVGSYLHTHIKGKYSYRKIS